jgi:polysaccharide deacetylase family protein (PEP-CTERM system associated)
MNRTIAVTVDVEEWYHSMWFNINDITSNPPSLCRRDLDSVLDFFRELDITATFFVLGEIAEKLPELVERIASDGHEVACHGYFHDCANNFKSQKFREQIRKAKNITERILGRNVLGYRAPNYGIRTEAVNILESLGFRYDSSVVPCLQIPGWYGLPFAPLTPYRPSRKDVSKEDLDRDFWEFPVAVFPGLRLPGGGGWFLRNFGSAWTKTIVKLLSSKGVVVIYVHPWEVSDCHPHLKGVPFHVFRRAGKYVRTAIRRLVNDFEMESVAIEDLLECAEREGNALIRRTA